MGMVSSSEAYLNYLVLCNVDGVNISGESRERADAF